MYDKINFGGIEFIKDECGDWHYWNEDDAQWYLASDLSFGTEWFLELIGKGELPYSYSL